MKKYGIILLTILALILAGTLYWLNKDNTVSVTTEEQTTLSPTQVESIEAIGEWEFLAINNEELVDTVRRGFFGDDQLVRIYYGTLRLGINMKDVKEGWIQANAEKDSIVCTLPPIRLPGTLRPCLCPDEETLPHPSQYPYCPAQCQAAVPRYVQGYGIPQCPSRV